MDAVYQSITGYSLIGKTGLFSGITPLDVLPEIWPIRVILPSLVIVQIALFDLLYSVGVRPDIVVGHSAGETGVLYASGAASKAMAVELAIARGEAMALAETMGGTMAALSCGLEDAQDIIEVVTGGNDAMGKLEIACFNSHEAVTLAGLEAYVIKAVNYAEARGIFARKLRTLVPIHSSLMEVCQEKYETLTNQVFDRFPGIRQPKITTYSTLTGKGYDEPYTSNYFWDNTRKPVLFVQAISNILSNSPLATFVEISPHPTLSTYLTTLGADSTSVICPMRRSKNPKANDEASLFLESLGRLMILGHNMVDFVVLNGRNSLDFDLNAPPYPFAKKLVPYYPEYSPVLFRQMAQRNGPLNDSNLRINHQTHPELAQHVIKGEPILPAAGYLEMVSRLRSL